MTYSPLHLRLLKKFMIKKVHVTFLLKSKKYCPYISISKPTFKRNLVMFKQRRVRTSLTWGTQVGHDLNRDGTKYLHGYTHANVGIELIDYFSNHFSLVTFPI